ncbi:hypothetical protein MB901379_03884 [Mycobacterium basiliense]|uniref:Uncharacterized protein n=1 Tax=Mycobacterium basiliense TaxID=2094119 RepID=A0A447GIM9_9MYCO|nr:hypothetical protein [Mycobacterium basiliense]VDM90288.1 hypothetical protein MB901379_03884 [Mycobacterium basiliense]
MTPAEPTMPEADTAAEPPRPDPATQATPEGAQPEPEPTPNSEAARYRVERNKARAERDALAERLAGYQRRECEAVVADVLDVPGDLWEVGGADVAAFCNDDGTVNEVELLGAAAALVDMRPRLGKPNPGPRYWGQHSADVPGDGKVGWSDVISPG